MAEWPKCKGCPEDGQTIHTYGQHVCLTTGLDPQLGFLTAREAHQLSRWLEEGDRAFSAA